MASLYILKVSYPSVLVILVGWMVIIASLDEDLMLATTKIDSMDPHPFAIGKVQFLVCMVNAQLFWCVYCSRWNDCLDIRTIEVA